MSFLDDLKNNPLKVLFFLGNYVRDLIITAGEAIGQDLSGWGNLVGGIIWIFIVAIIINLLYWLLRFISVIIHLIRGIKH